MHFWPLANSQSSRNVRISWCVRSGALAYVHHKTKKRKMRGPSFSWRDGFSPSPFNVRVCTFLLIVNNSKKKEYHQKHAKLLIEHTILLKIQRNLNKLKTFQTTTIFKISRSPRLELPIPDLRLSICRRNKTTNKQKHNTTATEMRIIKNKQKSGLWRILKVLEAKNITISEILAFG